MTAKDDRDERLAARLRENLRRRKTQARDLRSAEESGGEASEPPKAPKRR